VEWEEDSGGNSSEDEEKGGGVLLPLKISLASNKEIFLRAAYFLISLWIASSGQKGESARWSPRQFAHLGNSCIC